MSRGTWQGSGTWQSSGPDGAVVIAIVAVVACAAAAEWVARHAWELVAVTVTAGVLVLAGVFALYRWCNRRDARVAAAWEERRAVRAAGQARAVPHAGRPGIGRSDLHIHLHGTPTVEQAEVIRQALTGPGGDAITGEE